MTNGPGDFVEQHRRAGALLNGVHIGDNNAETERRKAALYVATQASDPPGFEWVGQHNRRKVEL